MRRIGRVARRDVATLPGQLLPREQDRNGLSSRNARTHLDGRWKRRVPRLRIVPVDLMGWEARPGQWRTVAEPLSPRRWRWFHERQRQREREADRHVP